MNQPLSYTGFILCLVLITICFIAAVYLSYRKSSRLRDMVQFVVSPKDDLVLDFKITKVRIKSDKQKNVAKLLADRRFRKMA